MLWLMEKFFLINKITDENIRKTATGQRDDYTTGCLLNYAYFKDCV